MAHNSERNQLKFLGIEGGGTRTVALLANEKGQLLRRVESGPGNLKLLTDRQLAAHFRSLAQALPQPDSVGIGLAGGWEESDWARIRAAAAKAWPRIPSCATNDLEIALAAAGNPRGAGPQVLIVSGTGSGCYGKMSSGRVAKVGGWGHVIGDQGSGYSIGLKALRSIAASYDRGNAWPRLGARILRSLQLNVPNELIDWAQGASKADVAALAEEVFAAWSQGDRLASALVKEAAEALAQDGVLCGRKLARPGDRVQFVLAGSILLKQPRFARRVGQKLRRLWPHARVAPLRRESVWGAVDQARRAWESEVRKPVRGVEKTQPKTQNPKSVSGSGQSETVGSTRLSPTELRNRLSLNLDKMPLGQAIRLMFSQDAKVPTQVLRQSRRIEQGIRAIVRAFRRGGRLFYVGAGTSGRLGVLDASECPPTFRTDPDMVQGIIAGGQPAFSKSAEGAEDNSGSGAEAIRFRAVAARDVVVGIAASGTTPFVWGALGEAKRRGATTVLVCFNPFLKIPRPLRPNIVIAANPGPELLTGSTRLKAGTATKLILNAFTTLAMVRLGKVRSNLMIDLKPANAKLRDRAIRIVQELTGAELETAQTALEEDGWVIRKALQRLRL